MTTHRFNVPGVAPGFTELPEAARTHVSRVLRLKEGDRIRVFDNGFEFSATISSVEKRRITIDVLELVADALPERRVPIHLIMSPLKGDLTELVIQKATELGVAHISPAVFERTDTVARRETADSRLTRWRRVATSAAEQSERVVVPRIDTAVSLKEAVATLGTRHPDQLRVVAAEPSLGLPAQAAIRHSEIRSIVVAAGPAGGMTPADLKILIEASFSPERFAIHTLRSETACIAALSILGDRFK